jgi:hypothetical protein
MLNHIWLQAAVAGSKAQSSQQRWIIARMRPVSAEVHRGLSEGRGGIEDGGIEDGGMEDGGIEDGGIEDRLRVGGMD